MDNLFNINFLLLVVIIVFLFKHRVKLYTSKTKNFETFLNPYKEIKPKKLYTLDHDELEFIHTLYSSFKYSMEYKLAFELTKIFRIKNKETLGMYHNLHNQDKKKQLFLCSEADYYNSIQNKSIDKKNLQFVCGFYYLHFLLFVRMDSKIDSWSDFIMYLDSKEGYKKKILKSEKIVIGVPNLDSPSYHDAKKLFSCVGIDIENPPKKIIFILDTEKNLVNLLKGKKIDCLYLTTSGKHPYIIEYLNGFNINVLDTEDLNPVLIDTLYHDNTLFNHRLDKKIFTKIVKKKNIYEEENLGYMKLINNSKETTIIGSPILKVKSSRVILLARKEVDKYYIKYFLRNIYGSLDKLRNILNNYLLVEEKQNFLISPLDPYEMAYCHLKAEYHPGAYDFYKEIQLISDSDEILYNPFVEENKYFKDV